MRDIWPVIAATIKCVINAMERCLIKVTDEILHVHHWHRKKITCLEHPPSTDLSDIECCCRCNQEREIKPETTSYAIGEWEGDPRLMMKRFGPEATGTDPRHVSGEEGKKQFLDHVHAKQDARQKSIDRLRKEKQRLEFADADATLRAYHEKKARKKTD
jgi:hypothetical protein